MTLDDIERMDKAMITAKEAARVIGCNEQALRIQAKENPAQLGFNVTRINNTLYIPREAFLKHMGRDARCAPHMIDFAEIEAFLKHMGLVRRPEDDRA